MTDAGDSLKRMALLAEALMLADKCKRAGIPLEYVQ